MSTPGPPALSQCTSSWFLLFQVTGSQYNVGQCVACVPMPELQGKMGKLNIQQLEFSRAGCTQQGGGHPHIKRGWKCCIVKGKDECLLYPQIQKSSG